MFELKSNSIFEINTEIWLKSVLNIKKTNAHNKANKILSIFEKE